MTGSIPEHSGVPVWQDDSEASQCPICHTNFSFWFRRHHCRMCGRVVCANCSPQSEKYLATTYVVTPPNQPFLESPHVPHRTCLECIEELQMIRRALGQLPGSNSNRHAPHRAQSEQSAASQSAASQHPSVSEMMVQSVFPGADNDYLGRCPVCDKQLFSLPEHLQEQHIESCLQSYSKSPSNAVVGPQRKRMLISRLGKKECEALVECMICYEDFEPGQNVGRLECLCVFHEKCIFEWFNRKSVGSCPLHNQ